MEVPDAEEGMARLRRNPTYKAELQELLGVRLDDLESLTPSLQLPFECPLDLHGLYTLDEFSRDWDMKRRRIAAVSGKAWCISPR